MTVERLYLDSAVEVRSADGEDRRTIGGYASVYERRSVNLGGFVETVGREFFDESRDAGFPGVIARYNHEVLLGTVKAGTLRLATDVQGLRYEVDLPESRADVLELVRRGDVDKSSFAFRAAEDDWTTTEDGIPHRVLVRGALVDVAPVDTPAYPDSSAGLRSLASHFEADEDEVRQLASTGELGRFFRRTDNRGPVTLTGHQAVIRILGRR